MGWNKIDISNFISKIKQDNLDYENYLQLKQQNKDIESENNKNKQINDINITRYNRYNKIQQDFYSFLNEHFPGKKIEDVDYSSLESDNYLYNEYIKMGWNKIDISNFISKIKQDNLDYENYIKLNQQNKDIESENNKNRQINDINIKRYNEKKNLYDKYIIEYEKYNNRDIKIAIKITDEDDLSISFIEKLISHLTNLLCELYCPHCNKGIIFKDGKLNKGKISLDQKENILNLLNSSKAELTKRKKNEQLNQISKPIEVEIPERKSLIEIIQLYDIKILNKPKITLCEFPILSYNDVINLTELKNKYNLFLSLEEVLPIKESNLLPLTSLFNIIFINKPISKLSEIPTLSYKEVNVIDILLSKYQIFLTLPNDLSYPTLLKISDIITNVVINKPLITTFEMPLLSFDEINNITLLKDKYDILYKTKKLDKVNKSGDIEEFIKIDLKSYVKVNSSKLNSFEIPSLSYNDILSIDNSKKYIDKYNVLVLYSGEKYDYNKAKENYNQLILEKNDYEKKKIEYELLNKQLFELPKIDDKISEYLIDLKKESVYLDHKINAFQISNEYNNLLTIYNNLEKEIFELTNKNNNLNKIYKIISEMSSRYLEEVIDDINSSLKFILDELFDKPIEVKLSTHKILKNGTDKLEINLEVGYANMIYENLNFLSGGEKDRISLALLLSFSKMKNQNVIILDEVCASLNDELRDKVLDIINEWNKDKIIINICHGISKGMHENVISL